MRNRSLPLLLLTMILAFGQMDAQPDAVARPIVRLNTLNDLAHYSGNADLVFVSDPTTGGLFSLNVSTATADNGIIFESNDKAHKWIRAYDKAQGVNIAWFGARLDGMRNDADALKRALAYPIINVTGNVGIDDNVEIPANKKIVFTPEGCFSVTAGHKINFNAHIDADDYQYIFKGEGEVVFGHEAARYISACWFGAVADCKNFTQAKGSDNTSAIQKTIVAAQNVSDVFLPPTAANLSYRIASTISISKKQHFFSFSFHGGGTTITESAGDRATTIFADMTSGAAINVQGSRRVYLDNFILHGLNKNAHNVIGGHPNNPAVQEPRTFLSNGLAEDYTGITTDAEKENKVWSADIVFHDLQIENFALGIGISQAGNVQGDRMRLEDCQINDCMYAVSLGNAQNRSCHFQNLDINRVWCCFTNNTFGNGTGSEFQVTGGQWCNCYKLFHIQPYNMGQCSINGVYAENIGCIGDIGTGSSNNNSILFSGCDFMLQDAGFMATPTIYTDYYTLTSYANVSFASCNFWTRKPYIAFYAGYLNGYAASNIQLTGCTFYKSTMLHVWGNVTVENSFIVPQSLSRLYNSTVRVQLDANSRYNTYYNTAMAISVNDNVYGGSSKQAFSKQVVRQIPKFYAIKNGRENMSEIKISGDTISFRYNPLLSDALFQYVLPGDILGSTIKGVQSSWDNPCIEVLSIDKQARHVIARLYTNDVTFDKLALYTNCFITTGQVTGTVTKGADRIEDVDNIDKLQAGDFVTFGNAAKSYRIASVDVANKTVQLMSSISDDVSGRQAIFNQLLIEPGKQ